MKLTLIASAAALCLGTIALADGHSANPAVAARQAHMQLYSFNMGVLGNMAAGKADYDAAAAQTAADNMVNLVSMDQSLYWPVGTDMDSIDGTKTRAALWENFGNVMEIAADFEAAADAMSAAAGTDLASLQGAMGPLGASCSACHREYRSR